MPEDFDINNIINDGAEPDPASVQLPEHNHDPEITADQSAADPMLIIPEATEIADPLEGEEISVEEILKEANRVLGNNVDVHDDPAFEQDDHDIGSDDAGRFAEESEYDQTDAGLELSGTDDDDDDDDYDPDQTDVIDDLSENASSDVEKKPKKSRKKKKRAKAAAALEEARRLAALNEPDTTSSYDTDALDLAAAGSSADASAAVAAGVTGAEVASGSAGPAAVTKRARRLPFRANKAENASGDDSGNKGASDDDVRFDAVVGADGAIKGVLDGKEDSSSGKEIPAVIAAASPKEKKNSALNDDKKGKARKDSGKKNSSSKNTVTGTSAKITGASKNKKVRRRASFWQVLVRMIIFFICIGILGGCALAVGLTMYIADVTADDDKILNLDNIKLSLATTIMVKDPETGEWYEHERIYGGENREWVEYSDFPDCLIDSIIASEDIRFRTHHGVDWKRTTFAFLNQFLRIFGIELASNIQGGSTITQQLIKNITNEKDVEGLDGILRKVREIYRALEMEKNFSKTQILEAYLNTFRLGGQVAGIESAAKYYFGKTTSELDLAECCSIVCITKYPGAYDPYIDPEENKTQRDFILWTMFDQGMITRTQYDSAIAKSDEMVFDESNIYAGATSKIYDYFTDVVIDQVYEDLKKYKDLSPDDAYTLLYEGGLKIYTTMDPTVQKAVESAAWDDDIWPDYEYNDDGEKDENQIEGAIVVMNYDGEVVGCAGGIREKTTSLSLSRAYSTTRQTGSSMKPLAVYAPAIEMKKVHYSTLFPDKASDNYNGYPWPRNFSYTYGSPVTIYKAVCDSLNTIAALTMQLVGPDFSFDFLTSSMGFTTLVDNRWDDYQGMYLTDRTKSLALGGLTDGCTVTEMCAAYATFGNGGVYKSPRYYTKIEDSNGDIVLDKNKVCQTNQALSPQTAYIMNQMLRGVTREGTGTVLNRGTSQITACKTGTSSDNNDFWVCALNPYYCIAGWMGYDLNGWMNYSLHYDIQYAVRDVLVDISNDLPYKDFDRPDGIVTATFCMSSGDIATSACGSTRTGYYTSDNYPSGSCMHSLYNNDGSGGYYSSGD